MRDVRAVIEELTKEIEASYEESVTIDQAEKLASRFLGAQLLIASALKNADLDARMRKAGLKGVKSSVYLEAATSGDKKPSDTFLQNLIDADGSVQLGQKDLDTSEVYAEELRNILGIFREAHIHFRGIAKGRFE